MEFLKDYAGSWSCDHAKLYVDLSYTLESKRAHTL